MTIKTPENYLPTEKEAVSLDAGDVCIAGTFATGEPDIRRNIGDGRVLVYDKHLKLKGALWTGETGLVLGVQFCTKTQTLFVSDASSKTIKRFSKAGVLLEAFPDMQGKPFGAMACHSDGGLVVGEHIKGDKFPFLGGGEIYTFDRDGHEIQHYPAEHDPGKFGFHGVTSLALSADGKIVTYISETGQRVMRYDIENGRQLDDAFVLQGETVLASLTETADGRLLISTVYGAALYSPEGVVLREFDLPNERGWAAVCVSADGLSFFVANFFTGRLEKRDIETGEILASTDTGLVYKLASICEVKS